MRTTLAILALALTTTSALADDSRFSDFTKIESMRAQMDNQVQGQEAWIVSLIERGGVEGLARPITVDGDAYLYAETCRPHMCSDYALALLVGPDQQVHLYTFGDEVKDGLLVDVDNPDILGTFLTQTTRQ